MTTRGLREPDAETASPVQPDAADPVVELAQRYIETTAEFDDAPGKTDEEVEAFCNNVEKPLERELMGAHPASREGVVALLDLVLHEERVNNPRGAEVPWMCQYTIALLENARDAVKGGVGVALQETDAALGRLHASVEGDMNTDPVMQIVQTLPALFDEQKRLEIKKGKQGKIGRGSDKYNDLIQATEKVIAQTLATSLKGALAQIAIANHFVHEIEDWVEDEAHQDRANDARALLHSAVLVIEATTGARRPEVTARHHMIDAHNPQIAREAVKAGAS